MVFLQHSTWRVPGRSASSSTDRRSTARLVGERVSCGDSYNKKHQNWTQKRDLFLCWVLLPPCASTSTTPGAPILKRRSAAQLENGLRGSPFLFGSKGKPNGKPNWPLWRVRDPKKHRASLGERIVGTDTRPNLNPGTPNLPHEVLHGSQGTIT